jgi:hypothetical protein
MLAWTKPLTSELGESGVVLHTTTDGWTIESGLKLDQTTWLLLATLNIVHTYGMLVLFQVNTLIEKKMQKVEKNCLHLLRVVVELYYNLMMERES